MPNDKAAPKELKVTDKRIFTPDGEIRDEFKQDIRPNAPEAPAQQAQPEPETTPQETASATPDPNIQSSPYFAALVDQLYMQAAMYLGLQLKGYQAPPMKPNPAAAREIIEILNTLQEKTKGNLSAEEAEFLKSTISELKLAYVQRTKNI